MGFGTLIAFRVHTCYGLSTYREIQLWQLLGYSI
jgi:hypothetical protein